MRTVLQTSSTPFVDTLLKRYQERSAVIGVIGLGYVGLPWLSLGRRRTRGVGLDVDPEKPRR